MWWLPVRDVTLSWMNTMEYEPAFEERPRPTWFTYTRQDHQREMHQVHSRLLDTHQAAERQSWIGLGLEERMIGGSQEIPWRIWAQIRAALPLLFLLRWPSCNLSIFPLSLGHLVCFLLLRETITNHHKNKENKRYHIWWGQLVQLKILVLYQSDVLQVVPTCRYRTQTCTGLAPSESAFSSGLFFSFLSGGFA